MNRTWRLLGGGAVAAGVVAAVFFLPRKPGEDFATPGECLETFREAGRAGDVERYLSCLDEPLRSAEAQLANGPGLRERMAAIKTWTEKDPEIGEQTAQVDVDQVRADGTWRVRFHLRKGARGWRINAMEPPRAIPGQPRFGTPVE